MEDLTLNEAKDVFAKELKCSKNADAREPVLVDEVFERFGRYSRAQLLVFCHVAFYNIIAPLHTLAISFIGATPDHHCRVPPGVDPVDVIPVKYDSKGAEIIDKCHLVNLTSKEVEKCPGGWWYSDEDESTIVTEWDLVCDKTFLVQASQSVYMAAWMVGALVAPTIADHIGRKHVVIFCGVIWGILGVISAFVNHFYLFTTLRAMMAALHMGGFLVSYCLLSEYYSTSHRAFAANGIYIIWALGLMILPGIAYFVRNWRHLQLIISAPLLLMAVGFWTLPESVHYLVTHGRVEEGEELIRKMAKFSKITIPEDLRLKVPIPAKGTKDKARINLVGILLTPYLRIYALIIVLVWTVNALVYYGLSLGTNTLAGNKYLNFFLSGAIEVPAYITCMYVLMPWGRRKPTLVLHVLAGLPLIIAYFIPENTETADLTPLILTLNLIGKYGITATFSAIYLITSEVYPTVVRTTGVGISSFSARVGGALAPFTVYLKEIAPAVAPILFGILAIGAGIMVMFLPETASRDLPETLNEYSEWLKNKEEKDNRSPSSSHQIKTPL